MHSQERFPLELYEQKNGCRLPLLSINAERTGSYAVKYVGKTGFYSGKCDVRAD